MRSNLPSDLRPDRTAPRRARSTAGYTLTEILIATSILGMATIMTFVVFIAAMKRAQHTELALDGTAQLRMATDIISQAVRSSSALPTVNADGTELTLAPNTLPYLTVANGPSLLPPGNTVRGWRANQQVMQLEPTVAASSSSIFAGAARPSGAITAADVSTYFKASAPTPDTSIKVADLLGATVAVPGTAMNPPMTLTVRNVSNNSGRAAVQFTNNLGSDVPDGTTIRATNGPRAMFRVTATGSLLYFPNASDTSVYTLLAKDISPTPLSDPAVSTSDPTVPFSIPSTASNYVIINLQKLPDGKLSGRTLQGVQTTVFMRTNPLAP